MMGTFEGLKAAVLLGANIICIVQMNERNVAVIGKCHFGQEIIFWQFGGKHS